MGRETGAGRPLNDGGGEAGGGDGDRFKGEVEEAAHEADGMIAVGDGDVGVGGRAEFAGAGEVEAGGVMGLRPILLGDLNARAGLHERVDGVEFGKGFGGWGFHEDGEAESG